MSSSNVESHHETHREGEALHGGSSKNPATNDLSCQEKEPFSTTSSHSQPDNHRNSEHPAPAKKDGEDLPVFDSSEIDKQSSNDNNAAPDNGISRNEVDAESGPNNTQKDKVDQATAETTEGECSRNEAGKGEKKYSLLSQNEEDTAKELLGSPRDNSDADCDIREKHSEGRPRNGIDSSMKKNHTEKESCDPILREKDAESTDQLRSNERERPTDLSKPTNGSAHGLSLTDASKNVIDEKKQADTFMPANDCNSSIAATDVEKKHNTSTLHSTETYDANKFEGSKQNDFNIEPTPIPYQTDGVSNNEENKFSFDGINDEGISNKRSTPDIISNKQSPPDIIGNKRSSPDVIELLDDDEAVENDISNGSTKKIRMEETQSIKPGEASYQGRMQHLPHWMHNKTTTSSGPRSVVPTAPKGAAQRVVPGVPGINYHDQINSAMNVIAQNYPQTQNYRQSNANVHRPFVPNTYRTQPEYLYLPTDFVPTWDQLLPPYVPKVARNTDRRPGVLYNYRLSLLNCTEFGVTGDLQGLRTSIKQISRGHGKAVYEKVDGEQGEEYRWRVPLGAYHPFVAFLNSDPKNIVEPIPEMQLKIASLGKARLEKGFPPAKKLIKAGVPSALANALAPFQRGGVDFVVEKSGRALIADEMGLGKTIQGIASMSIYQREWPLLVLCPSSARYHWESEFRNWLGRDGNAVKNHKCKPIEAIQALKSSFQLLKKDNIYVLSSSKGKVIPTNKTKVVICSYGLAPMLIKSKKIFEGQFKCAIADESHMLKNMSTKRTSLLLPILAATTRCVLLSGTPALSRPAELWPQLKILGTERYGWWQGEEEYMDKYAKYGNASTRAELHTMLTGTVMIRRLKADILKTMKPKRREKAMIHVSSQAMREEFHECMKLLRRGKGILGKLARQHTAIGVNTNTPPEQDLGNIGADTKPFAANTDIHSSVKEEVDRKYVEGKKRIEHTLWTTSHQLNEQEVSDLRHRLESDLRAELDVYYRERVYFMKNSLSAGDLSAKEENQSPKSVLNHMYNLTGKAKLPIILDMLRTWLGDRTKGKVCIFAHHLSILDEIQKGASLSNSGKGDCHPFIRIDGSTNPKSRFEQIDKFQKDASVRVALLGITAAGVAVTLTASSTVWFAELFWTPAIMVQAEDRCHRIGQQGQVQCLYFVAKGTLDEVLWKLLEKKLQDIGEFVEGLEKLKLVVNRTYKNEKELKSTLDPSDGYQSDDDFKPIDFADSDKDAIDFDNEMTQVIEELGQEEQKEMMSSLEVDEDEIDRTSKPEDQTVSDFQSEGPGVSQGGSQEEAIDLSDDEEETTTRNKAVPSTLENGDVEGDKSKGDNFDMCGALPRCRLYRLRIHEQKLGVSVGVFKRRVVMSSRAKRGKPDIGDVLVACNGSTVPLCNSLAEVLPPLERAIKQYGPTELIFAEDEEFSEFYKKATRVKKLKTQQSNGGNVIDLIDDD